MRGEKNGELTANTENDRGDEKLQKVKKTNEHAPIIDAKILKQYDREQSKFSGAMY
jgi:hypothetical protein